ncbi:hypothetical protein [Clostridium senegalense]|uniref:hypothetical protein n=1 Tax=Clostridium senegalense TaxID=1465809 RepID=UPI001C116F2C|nr:hypothetical protein [Clostridium senegalense]MBU5227832.1 hypothetical protein [Clostridium senegalense]
MRLKELRNILNADMIKIYIDYCEKENYFVKEKNSKNNEYLLINKESLSMWIMYGEYEVKEIYVEEVLVIII